MSRLLTRALLALSLLLGAASRADAQLVVHDFLAAGDRLLVDDRATGLTWLTPVYTRNQSYNSALVQSIMASHGFRYATGAEVQTMIASNFGDPASSFPGDAAGFIAAGQFLQTFGRAAMVYCTNDAVHYFDCPRTQDFTSTAGPRAGSRQVLGMMQFDRTGFAIYDNPWAETDHDTQTGSWLVRDTTVTPEPATWALLGTGLVSLGVVARRRRRA